MALGDLRKKRPAAASLYDTDFHRWAKEQARAVREARVSDIDWENVAEEIESLGRSDKRALESHLEVLIAHLLKCSLQPSRRTRSWDQTIRAQRDQIASLIARNPSLHGLPAVYLKRGYRSARNLVARDTGLDDGVIPTACPFTVDQVLDPHFFP